MPLVLNRSFTVIQNILKYKLDIQEELNTLNKINQSIISSWLLFTLLKAENLKSLPPICPSLLMKLPVLPEILAKVDFQLQVLYLIFQLTL